MLAACRHTWQRTAQQRRIIAAAQAWAGRGTHLVWVPALDGLLVEGLHGLGRLQGRRLQGVALRREGHAAQRHGARGGRLAATLELAPAALEVVVVVVMVGMLEVSEKFRKVGNRCRKTPQTETVLNIPHRSNTV